MNDITLANGAIAVYTSTRKTIIPDIDKENETDVHNYTVPCPLCGGGNNAYSYDGVFFANLQITCRSCGIFFRPIPDRNMIPTVQTAAVATEGSVPKSRFTQEEVQTHRHKLFAEEES